MIHFCLLFKISRSRKGRKSRLCLGPKRSPKAEWGLRTGQSCCAALVQLCWVSAALGAPGPTMPWRQMPEGNVRTDGLPWRARVMPAPGVGLCPVFPFQKQEVGEITNPVFVGFQHKLEESSLCGDITKWFVVFLFCFILFRFKIPYWLATSNWLYYSL